ncbi:MAG: hypothetical protein R3F59_36995 [Myxococcota bacterium]
MSLGMIASALLAAGIARAQVPSAPVSDVFSWTEPSPEEQLEADRTVIPIGKGAVFVPSITGPLNEPPVILVDAEDDEVIDIPTGQRVLVDPGRYVVIVSSGTPMQGVGTSIEVFEGETTMAPVHWGALRIEVTDDHRVPHRGSYELINATTREPYGTGFGADTLQGESLMTWLLPPGVYRIVKPGSNYRALRDFATVYVPEAGFVRYRLVLDPDTGEFQGSGVLMPDEFGSPSDRDHRWFSSLVLGAVGSLAQQQNVVGVNNQLTVAGSLFVDGQVAYNVRKHSVTTLLQVEEGASQIRPQESLPLPLVKTRDRLRLDGLYTFYAKPWLGPYARVTGETQAFGTRVLVTEDTTIGRTWADGSQTEEIVPANQQFFVANAWAPTLMRQGGGLNTRFVNNRWVTLNFRVGLGLRQNLYAGAWVIEDQPRTPEIEYRQVDSFNQEGVEGTIIATARLPGWAVYATDIELFGDFADFGRPSVEWRNTFTLRLTRNLSLNYYLNLERVPQVVDTLQLEQSVLLRASWAVF